MSARPNTAPLRVAVPLVFASGLTALLYQTVWMSSFRLIFGASTPATGAVLAIFMGGLGFGGWLWGRRLDDHQRPLAVYAALELVIAVVAALSPFLLTTVHGLYAEFGGPLAFNGVLGVIVRLLLASLVMGVPVFCMGGTLPAMARFVTHDGDTHRQGLAALYGCNTLGSVFGALLGTFYLFERFGLQRALWLAASLNVVVAGVAWYFSRRLPATALAQNAEVSNLPLGSQHLPRTLILAAAYVAGFVFFVAEMVWFRMSAPILGGTTYSFGLVLAWALVGIGAGAIVYQKIKPTSLTPQLLVATFLLEGLTLLVPFAIGDDLALWAHRSRLWAGDDFFRLCLGWSLVSAVLVLPPALVAGFQFPVLVALRGAGPGGVARDVGALYLANTVGALSGSLAGGFGLMPWLGALGVWKGCAIVAAGMGLLIFASDKTGRGKAWTWAAPLLGANLLLVAVPVGPTAVWRHSGVGAGRSSIDTSIPNDVKKSVYAHRRSVSHEFEGVESPIGVLREGLSLLISGKSDGNAWKDAMTTVMLGLTGAMIHPEPKRAFVVGLGAGQTAGWLAEVPTVERVDVVELEPEVERFAEMAKVSNFDVLNHPKVNLITDDGRVTLMAAQTKYDLIVSEPSNPYRTGVASFFTHEFYEQVENQLQPGGYFSQWVQGYEIDAFTLDLILSTLRGVFDHVSVWSLMSLDYVIVASNHPQVYDVSIMERHAATEPFKTALNDICGIYDVAGFLALHEASPAYIAAQNERPYGQRNSDDRNLLEYRFAKSMGTTHRIYPKEIYANAKQHNQHRPAVRGLVDWPRVDLMKNRTNHFFDVKLTFSHHEDWWALLKQNKTQEAATWLRKSTPAPTYDYFERAHRFEFALYFGSQIEALPKDDPQHHPDLDPWLTLEGQAAFFEELRQAERVVDAAWLQLASAVLRGHEPSVVQLAERAFQHLRTTPWVRKSMVERVLGQMLAQKWSPETARLLAALLAKAPFALHAHEHYRAAVALVLAERGADWELCAGLYEAYEAHPLWELHHLERRLRCYEQSGNRATSRARADLNSFLSGG